MTRIVALDISKAACGAAMGSGADEAPRMVSRSLGGQTLGATGAAFGDWLRDLFLMEKPDCVAIEAPLVVSGPHASAAGVKLLMGLVAVAHVAAHRAGARVVEANVQSWRKAILGNGRPKDPKRAALDFCASVGWDAGGSHDRAEAACVWAWAHLHYGDRAAMHRLLARQSLRV